MKKCCGCKKLRALSEFHANKNMIDGKATTCKACIVVRQRARYKELLLYRQLVPKLLSRLDAAEVNINGE